MFQAWFRILGQELFYWPVKEIFSIYECRVIINKLIIRFTQNGMVTGEDKTVGLDLVGIGIDVATTGYDFDDVAADGTADHNELDNVEANMNCERKN